MCGICGTTRAQYGGSIGLTSRGPMNFRQTRCGRGGRLFTCYKLRTMVDGAERRRAEVLPLNEASGPVIKARNAPRVTAVGRWLRKTSIDELPQLVNVLRGEMTVVGPRPPIPEESDRSAPAGVQSRLRSCR